MSESGFLYFLSGLGIGIGAGLLMAPKSGAHTRAAIKGSMIEGQNYIREQGNQFSDAVRGTFDRAKEAAREVKEGVAEAF